VPPCRAIERALRLNNLTVRVLTSFGGSDPQLD
jgi:hypothetical protein